MNKTLHGAAAHLHDVYTVNGGVKNYNSKIDDNGFCKGVLATTAFVMFLMSADMILNKIEHMPIKAKRL